MKKKIALLCFFEEGRISGPSNSLTGLASFYNGDDCEFHLYTTSKTVSNSFLLNNIKVEPFAKFNISIREYDLVVFSGIYDLNVYKASRVCIKNNIKYIVSPRSNLMITSFKKSYFKKKIAHLTYTKLLLDNAYALHFLSLDERNNSIRTELKYFISPNGFHPLTQSLDMKRKEKLITFIGRLDIYHKGLDLLCETLHHLKDTLKSLSWKVEMYGPGSINDRKDLQKLITKYGLEDLVSINLAVVGKEKSLVLERTMIFVHPSRFEGQPQAVLEAMAFGALPVTTLGTNMTKELNNFIKPVEFSIKDFSESIILAIEIFNDDLSRDLSLFSQKSSNWELCSKKFVDECKNIGAL
jgi:hypothetical protein